MIVTALAAFSAVPAGAQSPGFAVGKEVRWQILEQLGQSQWRPGFYSGQILEVAGGYAGQRGAESQTSIVNLQTGQSVKVRMDQLTSIRCPGERRKVKNYSYALGVCSFEGAAVGAYGVDYVGWMRVQLFEEVVLGDGSTARIHASQYTSLGHVMLGRGPNTWAKGASADKPSTQQQQQQQTTIPDSSKPQVTPHTDRPSQAYQVVPQVGQSYARALKVGYPAVIQATMSQGDYDTYLFDFEGGVFHAHSKSGLNLVADLLDAEGKFLARAQASGGTFQFDQNLPRGRYGIIIRVMNHGGAGPYELMLGSGGGPRYRESR